MRRHTTCFPDRRNSNPTFPEPEFDAPYDPSPYVMAKVPPKPKPKPNDVYVAIESPRGERGVYMGSDGSEKPYRMKIRGPAFVN